MPTALTVASALKRVMTPASGRLEIKENLHYRRAKRALEPSHTTS